MKRVHDIRYTKMGSVSLPVAFIQHGNKEDGLIYENICPLCAATLEKVTTHPEAEMTTVLNRLLQGSVRHYQFCPQRGSDTLHVEITTTPLQTEKIVREM